MLKKTIENTYTSGTQKKGVIEIDIFKFAGAFAVAIIGTFVSTAVLFARTSVADHFLLAQVSADVSQKVNVGVYDAEQRAILGTLTQIVENQRKQEEEIRELRSDIKTLIAK